MATAALRDGALLLRKASSLYTSTPVNWLTTRLHFSFAEYYDPSNVNLGVLRVLNDDLVKPQSGFDTHPHNNMEILSYVVDGELTHRDSMGSSETLGRGAIQFMSAGTGVRHSEHNRHPSNMLRFLQVWIQPNARGLPPQYGSRSFTEADRMNRLFHAVTGPTAASATAPPAPPDERRIVISQDANIFISEFDPEHPQAFTVRSHRQAYIVCVEGELRVNDVAMTTRDALMAAGPVDLQFTTPSRAHLYMVEIARE